jgi:hypothetical protein
MEAEDGRGARKALALADAAAERMNSTGLAAEQQEIAASGYDLSALATAALSPIEKRQTGDTICTRK